MSTQCESCSSCQRGYSYVEILLATILIVVSLIPAADALRASVAASRAVESQSAQHFLLMAKMEEVLADSYLNLEAAAATVGSETTPTVFSDPPATPDRRLVFLSAYDADNADSDNDPFTGTDPGLLWVRVEIEGTVQVLESLTAL